MNKKFIREKIPRAGQGIVWAILAIAILLVAAGLLWWFFLKGGYEMPLSGTKVKNAALTKKTPFAIVIENTPPARPQSGLNGADLVIETATEGGITRYLAVYQEPETLTQFGPVRSARTYFDEWAASYGAILVHFGGSQPGLQMIKDLNVDDVDGLRESEAFTRDPSRQAPHNAYTTYEKIARESQKKGYDLNRKPGSYKFKDDAGQNSRPEHQTVNINFSSAEYRVAWEYDPNTNQYRRVLNGQKHLDRITGQQLLAKNVIIQEILSQTAANSEQQTKAVNGSGKATIFLDGKQIDGTWRKNGQGSITRFYDDKGQEISLNRGQTWIEAIDQKGSFEIL